MLLPPILASSLRSRFWVSSYVSMHGFLSSWRRICFSFVFVALIGMSLWSARSLFTLIADNRATTHTSEVHQALVKIVFLMRNAERDNGSYILTGQQRYLTNYRAGRHALFAQFKMLQQLTQNNLSQQRALAVLFPLLQARGREAQQASRARQQHGVEAARAVVTRTLQLKTVDKSWDLIALIEAEEVAHSQREAQAHSLSTQLAVLSFLGSGFLVLALVLALAKALHRESAQYRQAETAVRQLNNDLETRVQQRTEHLHEASRQIQANAHHLENLNIEMLERLARAGEYRDDDTGQHTQRVGLTASLLAERLELSRERVRWIQQAARLHDVGKIGVSDTILLKPGKLTPQEFALMKEHTTIGAALLDDGQSEILIMAQRIAASHHERFDGSGYPHGLKGEEIPLEARIVAVADVFDALTHERPYKKAWLVEAAVEEIRAQSGKQFDPHVIEVFLSLPHEALI